MYRRSDDFQRRMKCMQKKLPKLARFYDVPIDRKEAGRVLGPCFKKGNPDNFPLLPFGHRGKANNARRSASLKKLTVKELHKLCKQNGVKKHWGKRKAWLITHCGA